MDNENILQIVTYGSVESERGVACSIHRCCLGGWDLLRNMSVLCVRNQDCSEVAECNTGELHQKAESLRFIMLFILN